MTNDRPKPGYEQTEVGVIPEDWLAKTFDDVVTGFSSGSTPSRTRPEFFKGDIVWITGGELDYQPITQSAEKLTQEAVQKSNLRIYPANTFVMGITGLEAEKTRGSCAITGVEATMSQQCMALLPKPEFSVRYLFHYYVAFGKKLALEYCQGTKQQSYSSRIVKILPITVPPTVEEQETISQALSDIDRLIAALEKAIAKKRAIKTATVQQLLTGKKRLLGFGEGKGYQQTKLGVIPEDWNVKCLGEVGQSLIGLTYRPEDTRDYGTLVLRSSNVQNDRLAYENNVYVDSALPLPSRVIVEERDILICVRNGSKQLIGKCALIDAEAAGSAFGAFMSVFRTKISGFVFYQFQSDVIQTQINEIMGATINQITNKDMAAFQIPLPPSDEEQREIATVLSDMDTEIAALETRIAKTQALKQGMMQALLTGRVRLV